jgi:RNA polymerase sigma factor (TIGR02999 family)
MASPQGHRRRSFARAASGPPGGIGRGRRGAAGEARRGRRLYLRGLFRVADLTALLRAADAGDDKASQELFVLLYDDLKRLAHGQLRKHGGGAEMQTTMLVHESYLRLLGNANLPAEKRSFYAYVGKVMRSVLLDLVRERQAQKRGGDQIFVTLNTGVGEEALDEAHLIALDTALGSLAKLAPDLKDVIEMRYFIGLSMEEIGQILGRSPRTVSRDWQKGRLLLRQLMNEA